MNEKTAKTELGHLIETATGNQSKILVEIAEEIIKSPPKSIEELESARQKLFAWGQEINNLRGFIGEIEKYISLNQ